MHIRISISLVAAMVCGLAPQSNATVRAAVGGALNINPLNMTLSNSNAFADIQKGSFTGNNTTIIANFLLGNSNARIAGLNGNGVTICSAQDLNPSSQSSVSAVCPSVPLSVIATVD